MSQRCLNCDHEFIADAMHCDQCGQKIRIQHLSFWSIVSDFFANLFNIETKIWRTLRDIWIPAKLSTAFVAGKRVSYYNPIRIFIITLFTFFTLFLFNIKTTFKDIDDTFSAKKHEIWALEMGERFDSLRLNHNWPQEVSDSIRAELFKVENVDINTQEDSIKTDSIATNDLISNPIDSLKTNISNKSTGELTFNAENGAFNFSLGDGEFIDGLSFNEFFRSSEEKLKDRYKDDSWNKRLWVIQLHKVMTNFSSSIQFLISNGTWTIIAMILLLSGFFKILFFRHNYLYAEHFIFHVYGHTRFLILAIIGITMELLFLDSAIWRGPLFILGIIFLYIGMYRYYNQSILKTSLKFIMTLAIYLFLFCFCLLLVFGLSFIFF